MNLPPFVMRPATSMAFQPGQAAAAPAPAPSSQTTQGRAHSAATSHADDNNNNHNHNDGNDAMLLSQLRRQVEFYFSDDNLARDGYLLALLHSRDHYGLVPLATIASFGRIREMYASHHAGHHVPARFAPGPADPVVVARSLAKSERVRVSPDGHWLRPASTAWTIGSGRNGNGNGNGGGPVAPHQSAVPGDDYGKNPGRPALSVSVETNATTTTTSSGSAATSPSITPTSFDSAEAASDTAAAGVSGSFARSDQHRHPHHHTSPHQPGDGFSGELSTKKMGPAPPSANAPPDAVPSTVSVTPRRGGNPGGVSGSGGGGTAPPGPTPPQSPHPMPPHHYPAPQPLSTAIHSQMPYLPVPTTAYQPMIMATYPNGMTAFMYPPQFLPFPPPHARGHAGGPSPAGPAVAVAAAAPSSPPSPPAPAYSPSQAPSAANHAHSPPQRGYVVPFHVPSQFYPPPPQHPQPPQPQNHPQQQPQYHPQGFVAMADAAGTAPTMMQQGEGFVPTFLPPPQQHPYHHHHQHPNPSGPAPATNTGAWTSNVDSQQASSLRNSPATTTATATTNSQYPPAATADAPFVALPQYAQYPGGYVAAVPAMGAVDSAGELYYYHHHHHHHNYPYYPVDGPPFVATAFGTAEGDNTAREDGSYNPDYGYAAFATDATRHRGTKSDESGSRDARPRRHQRATARGKDKNRDSDSSAPPPGPKLRGSSNSAAGSVTSVTSRSTVTTAEVVAATASAGRRPCDAVPAGVGDSTVPTIAEWVDVGRGTKGAAGRSSSLCLPSTATSSSSAAAAAMTMTAAPPPRIRAPKNNKKKKKVAGGSGSGSNSNSNNNGDNNSNNHNAASSKPNGNNGTSSKSNGGKKVDVGNALSEEHFPALGSPKGKPGGTKAGQGGVAAAGSGGGKMASVPRPSVPLPYAEAAKAKKRQDQPPKQAKQQQQHPKQQQQDAAAASTSTPDDVTREMLGLSVGD
jgi:La domain